jgi:hypothetical protein
MKKGVVKKELKARGQRFNPFHKKENVERLITCWIEERDEVLTIPSYH